jgi:hypothetical protein
MLIGEMPSLGGGVGVFSSVKTRPFFVLSGGGFGLADGRRKGQRFGHFSHNFLRAKRTWKVKENRVKA